MTSQEARMPLHVVVPAAMTGDVDLTVLCEQVRTISVERLDGRPYSRVDAATMAQVEQRLRVLLGL
jgi:mRNA-degrading endonuclease toxin of MazEF toxin-antitoxin module